MQKKNIIKFENIKELIYHSVNIYPNNIAFTSKIKDGKNTKYINHSYSDLLVDINCFGTGLYSLGLENKRIAVIGHNSYEWVVAHMANLLRRYCFCSFRQRTTNR